MTLRTNARVAGFTYFIYLAAGIGSLALAGRTQLTGVLEVFASFSALVLGVTLYALTRDQDRDLAMLGLVCRVIEAMPGRGEIYFAVGNAIFCWSCSAADDFTRGPARLAGPIRISSFFCFSAADCSVRPHWRRRRRGLCGCDACSSCGSRLWPIIASPPRNLTPAFARGEIRRAPGWAVSSIRPRQPPSAAYGWDISERIRVG
jgi:hypothetical protein